MNRALRLNARRSMIATLVPTSMVAMLAASWVGGSAGAGPTTPAAPAFSTLAGAAGDSAAAAQIVLRVGDGLATATLEDSPAAREFAAMLPLELTLHDPMGQAKSGQLPHPIDVTGADRVVDPDVAGIYYWPPSGDIGVVYYDLGQSVPPPGMVRLGAVDSGLDTIASAGNQFTVWIDRA